MAIRVAANDSPRRDKKVADFVIGEPAENEVQEIMDLAVAEAPWGCRLEVQFAPGHYRFTGPVWMGYDRATDPPTPHKNQGCDLAGDGQAIWIWDGDQAPETFLLNVSATSAVTYPRIARLRIDGNGKVSGLFAKRFGGRVEDIGLHKLARYGVLCDGAWWSKWSNVYAYACSGCVFALTNFNGGQADMIRAYNCDGSQIPEAHPSGVYLSGGGGEVTGLFVEECQYSTETFDYPAVMVRTLIRLENFRSECTEAKPKNANTMILMDGCDGAVLRQIGGSGTTREPGEALIRVQNSKNCLIDGVFSHYYREPVSIGQRASNIELQRVFDLHPAN